MVSVGDWRAAGGHDINRISVTLVNPNSKSDPSDQRGMSVGGKVGGCLPSWLAGGRVGGARWEEDYPCSQLASLGGRCLSGGRPQGSKGLPLGHGPWVPRI